jgi:biotin carboxylase
MDKIIILGAGVMQGPAIRIAGEMGLERHILDGNAEAVLKDAGEYFYPIDLKDKEGILSLAAEIKDKTKERVGIMTAGTDFSASVAYVAEKLGLPGHSYEAALNASDKARMRACFSKAGVPSPAFAIVDEAALHTLRTLCASGALRDKAALQGGFQAAEGGAKALPRGEGRPQFLSGTLPLAKLLSSAGQVRSEWAASCRDFSPHEHEAFDWHFPLVVKPCDNMGGRGCSRVNGPRELAAAAADAMRYSRTGRAIVEEYMDGPEFSVDAIVHDGVLVECGFADRHIFFPPYFIEMGHTIPSDIGTEAKQSLMRCFEAGVRALGLTSGAAKGDLKLTGKGPMIGEIAARLSGGYMSGWTFPHSSGFEVTRAAIEIAMGQKPAFSAESKGWVSAERAVISIPGTVRSVTGVEAASRRPGVQNVFMRTAAGGKVSFPRNNVEKCGNVISAARSRIEAMASAEDAANAILIRLEPGNPETEAFLAEPLDTLFPPSAMRKGADGVMRDYTGRTMEEIASIVRAMTGQEMPHSPKLEKALLRGGYQGVVYTIDTHGK